MLVSASIAIFPLQKEFANAEIEDLKKSDKENEVKIKELEDKILYQEVYNRRENLRFFGFPESADGAENTHEVVRNSLATNWRWKTQQILNSSKFTE